MFSFNILTFILMQPDFLRLEDIPCIMLFNSVSHSALRYQHIILEGQGSVLVKIVDAGAHLSSHLVAVGKFS